MKQVAAGLMLAGLVAGGCTAPVRVPVPLPDPHMLVADSEDSPRLDAVWRGAPAASFVSWERAEPPEPARRIYFSPADPELPARFDSDAAARAAFTALALLPGARSFAPSAQRSPAQAFYQRVVDVATSHPAFTGGELLPLVIDAPLDVIAYARGDVIVLINTRPRDVAVTVHGRVLHHARDLLHGWVQSGDRVWLSAYGTAVLDPRRR